MPKNTYGVDIPPRVLLHQQKVKGWTYKQIAERNDLTLGQVSGAIKYYKDKGGKVEQPDFVKFSLDERQQYTDDTCIVAGDFQIPTTDWDYAHLVSAIAKKHIKGDKILYIMGDWVNVDALSKYDKLTNVPTWDDERAASKHLLTEYLKVFDEIRFFPGNHERRWQAWMNGNDPYMNSLIDNLFPVKGRERIKFSIYDRCTVNNSTGKWTFVHGKNYSQNPLMNANKYAQKFESHVIAHHEHKCAIGSSKYGDYWIIDNGGLFDADKMAYVQLDTSTSPKMAQGFTMLKNGYPYVFGDWVDWSVWL